MRASAEPGAPPDMRHCDVITGTSPVPGKRSGQLATGATIPAWRLLERRLVELVPHRADLDAGHTLADQPAVFAGLELDEPMRGQRGDRISRRVRSTS